MLTVFQGETGGTIGFPIVRASAVSGALVVIGQHRERYDIDGVIESGVLYIKKRFLSILAIGEYTVLPHTTDVAGLIYFSAAETLSILGRP